MLIGIDLGTTFYAVATPDDRGRPVTVPNRDGDVLTPSAVYFAPDGSAVVGQAALDLIVEQPDRVATLIKRRMGYPDYGRPAAGREFRPETLSAVILRKLALDAETQLGPIDGCVITVPAYFDDTRRKATMDAGRIAGLNVIDIIDEPSAAALAYATQTGREPDDSGSTVLVYDLGGGTFDVTIVRLGKKRFQVLAIEGDVRLGGKDWDDRLVDWAAEKFRGQFGSDPRDDPQSAAMLHTAVERTKRALSKILQASVLVVHDGHRVTYPVSRADFETITKDLLVRTRLTTQQVLAHAGRTWDDVDKVLMVGGSTHMPATEKMLAELTGKTPDHSLAVSEVVARGAAVHAGIVAAQTGGKFGATEPSDFADVVEISVNAHALGVEVRDGAERVNHKLVPKNTQLPAAAEQVYYTVSENQTRVRVRILQGEANQAAACIPVGECWIDGLPESLPKGSPVRVRCGVAANGRIEVTATDLTSSRQVVANIHRPGGLTDDELAREAAWVQSLRVQ
jgi:molecular chaperone DnaK